MISLIPQKTTFVTTHGRPMNKSSWLRKYWDSFTYQLMIYYYYLAIAEDDNFQIHLHRPPNTCFVNNYLNRLTWIYRRYWRNVKNLKDIAQAYASNKEYSVQEAVYHCLPKFWLRNVFPSVIYANIKIPENHFKILLSQQEISELPNESEDIFKKNMLDKYMDMPDEKFQDWKLALVNFSYYSEFLR